MGNVGKWDEWYRHVSSEPGAFAYGDTVTYELGAEFLGDCTDVEDWGCGAGGFRRFRPDAIGIDGSDTPFADKKYVDLSAYTSSCDGIFMRHVLEHNRDWKVILDNAIRSARKKICVVLFTPLNDVGTAEIARNGGSRVDVPDLSLGRDELDVVLAKHGLTKVRIERRETATKYGAEHVVYIEK
jgi:hypothetical protein